MDGTIPYRYCVLDTLPFPAGLGRESYHLDKVIIIIIIIIITVVFNVSLSPTCLPVYVLSPVAWPPLRGGFTYLPTHLPPGTDQHSQREGGRGRRRRRRRRRWGEEERRTMGKGGREAKDGEARCDASCLDGRRGLIPASLPRSSCLFPLSRNVGGRGEGRVGYLEDMVVRR